LIVEFTRPNYRHASAFFLFFNLLFVVTFRHLKPSFLFVTVAMLSRYQSPIKCKSRKVGSNFIHKMNCCYCYCHFSSLELMQLPVRAGGLPSQGRGEDRILKMTYLFKNYIETDN